MKRSDCPGTLRAAAFTLIELMVVVGIIVLAAGMMAPTITEFFKNRQLETVRGRFGASFNNARLLAVNEARPVSIVFFREGFRVFNERTRTFEDTFIPETGPTADDKIWYELGFLRDKPPSTSLPKYRAWARAQDAARPPPDETQKGPPLETFNTSSLPRIRFERDGSLTFVNGSDISSAGFKDKMKIPETADIVIRQAGNTTVCFIDLRKTGQMRSRMEPTGQLVARPVEADAEEVYEEVTYDEDRRSTPAEDASEPEPVKEAPAEPATEPEPTGDGK
jgi:hypothetical protein